MNARQELLERGYVILYNAVSDETVDNLRAAALHDDLDWNDGAWNGEAFDSQRRQARLPDALSRVLMTTFGHQYMTFFPHATATKWSLLRTLAGALDQPVWRDFQAVIAGDGTANLSSLPVSLLVATQNDTVIYGYGWNRIVALRSNAELLLLHKGGMIMMQGDFMYAPAGYTTNNLCVHGYLDTPFYQRDVDQDQPQAVALIDDMSAIDDLFCYVFNCPFIGSGTTSLRKHLHRFHGFFFRRPRA
jgi:hypothetical protein